MHFEKPKKADIAWKNNESRSIYHSQGRLPEQPAELFEQYLQI